MSKSIVVSHFGRTVSSLDGKGQPHQPSRMINFTTNGAKLKFRYGYATAKAPSVEPGTEFACLGLGYVQNRSGTTELLGVEKQGLTILPYRYSLGIPGAFVSGDGREVIGPEDSLNEGDWIVASYADNAYFINPDAAALVHGKTVYRHVIGTTPPSTESWTKIEDVAYDPIADPELTVTPAAGEIARKWVDTDVLTYPVWDHTWLNSPGPHAIYEVFNSDGSATLKGWDDDDGPSGGELRIHAEFASSSDFSGVDYLYVVVSDMGATRGWFDSNTKPQFKLGSTWTEVESFEYFKLGSDAGEYAYPTGQELQAVYVMNVEALDMTDVNGFQFSMFVDPRRYGSDVEFFKISPIMFGGYYLNSNNSTHRLWDSDLDSGTITYGVRFLESDDTPSETIYQRTIDASTAYGFKPGSYCCPAGGRILLSSSVPDGDYSKVEFLRLDTSVTPAEWKSLAIVDSANWSHMDTLKEYQIGALDTVEEGVAPEHPPVFRTQGIVGAFPFKQFMVWLIGAGSENIQMSAVGDAEQLYVSEQEYDANDLTQPGVRTLADNADDQPVWGTQAGDVAVIVGRKAAYVMEGDFPVQMSPTRMIAGSRGIIGRFAGTRFRSAAGQYAAVYCDPDFNIWVVQSAPQFQGDGRGHPIELSLPVRGLLRTILFDEQALANPDLRGDRVQLEFDEESSALWVILGNRAAVYRQDMNEVGWEFYTYSLRSEGETTVETWTPYSGQGGIASSVPSGDAAFSNFGFPFVADDAYCSAGPIPWGTGKKTETLRIEGLMPESLLPVTADILGIKFQVERSRTGDFEILETKIQPRLEGTTWGANISEDLPLSETDTLTEFLIESALPTIEQVNNGTIGIDLQYTQQDTNPEWNDPENWTISVTGTESIIYGPPPYSASTSLTRTVHVVYIGPGIKPPWVRVSVTGNSYVTPSLHLASTVGGVSVYQGRGTADNGLGEVKTEDVYEPTSSYVLASSTKVFKVLLSDGIGTQPLTASGSFTPAPGVGGISLTYTVSGEFVPYVSSSVRVDSVTTSVHYSVTSEFAPLWVGWDQTCFTYDGKRVAIRSTGEIDLIEKDYRSASYITGPSRDGGYTPPLAEWTSQDFAFNGVTARFHGVQANTAKGSDSPSVFSRVSDGDWVSGFSTGYTSSRWYRFPLSQRAIQHTFKVTMPETTGGIHSMSLEFDQTSTSKVR